MEDILGRGASCLKNKCIITGGHYRIFFSGNSITESLNAGTVHSFRMAVDLFKISKSREIDADLGILINDMGSSCDENGCSIRNLAFARENYRLPGIYLDLLEQSRISPGLIKIYWEKHIRNRSKKEFLKRLKKEKAVISKEALIEKKADGFFLNDPTGYGKIILTRIKGRDKYGVPACPLIMAGLNLEYTEEYTASINYYYIGNDNLANIPNYFVIEKGKRVSEIFNPGISVNNIYFKSFK